MKFMLHLYVGDRCWAAEYNQTWEEVQVVLAAWHSASEHFSEGERIVIEATPA